MAESDDLAVQKQIDAINGRFEAAWSVGERPDFESYLNEIAPEYRERLLKSLLAVDLSLRQRAGQVVQCEDYESVGAEAVAYIKLLHNSSSATVVQGDQPAGSDNSEPDRETNSNSRQIGPYKLLQQIGEGGMGAVWMADQQEPVKRRVALKVIKAGLDSRQVIARFEAERQALAMMDHQNIAKVLDAGMTPDGRPYFAMELVDGIPITKYCDKNRLTPNERLELFVSVCNAIQHAHQKGIIHRDIKPSNVLVTHYDGKPIPKVIDFGLAKALQHQTQLTDKTMFTEFGQAVGTWLYMSPEQAERSGVDVDTRTDVYSLGVMLYELLAGSTPLERETIREVAWNRIVDLILEKEPPRPSTRLSDSGEAIAGISEQRKIAPAKLQQILRGDLDWIVMKALEKDRSRRYETASAFAGEVLNYLNGDPVNVRPPTFRYRLGKFVRKNQGIVTAAAIILTLLLAGVGGSSYGLLLAIKEKKRADTNYADAVLKACQARDAEVKALASKDEANQQRNRAQLAAREASNNLYESRRQAAWLARDRGLQLANSNQVDEALLWLARAIELAPDDDQSLQIPLRSLLQTWSQKVPLVTSVASFDGLIQALTLHPEKDLLLISTGPWSEPDSFSLTMMPGQPAISSTPQIETPGNLMVVDASSGKISRELVHRLRVYCSYFVADRNLVATGSGFRAPYEGELRMYDARTWEPVIEPLSRPFPVTDIVINANGPELVTYGMRTKPENAWELYVTDTDKLKIPGNVRTFSEQILSVQFGPTGQDLWIAFPERLARFELHEPGEIEELIHFDPPITSASFSPSAKFLFVTQDKKRKGRLWSIDTRQPVGDPFSGPGQFDIVKFNADEQLLAAADDNGTVHVRWTQSGKPWYRSLQHSETVWDLDFSSNSRLLAVGTGPLEFGDRNGKVVVWDLIDGRRAFPDLPAEDTIRRVLFDQVDDSLFTATRIDGVVKRRRIAQKDAIPGPCRIDVPCRSAKFSIRGDQVGIIDRHGRLNLFGIPDCDRQCRGLAKFQSVMEFEYSPSGEILGVAGVDPQEETPVFTLWRLPDSEQPILELPIDGFASDISFSDSGNHVAVTALNPDDGTAKIHVVNTVTMEVLAEGLHHRLPVSAVAFLSDESKIIAASGMPFQNLGELALWSWHDTSRPENRVEVDASLNDVAVINHGRQILTAGANGELTLWNPVDLTVTQRIAAHDDQIQQILRSRYQDNVVLTITTGGECRLWDLVKCQPLGPSINKPRIEQAFFGSDAKQFVTVDQRGMLEIRESNSGQPLGAPEMPMTIFLAAAFDQRGDLWTVEQAGYVKKHPGFNSTLDLPLTSTERFSLHTGKSLDEWGGIRFLNTAEWQEVQAIASETGQPRDVGGQYERISARQVYEQTGMFMLHVGQLDCAVGALNAALECMPVSSPRDEINAEMSQRISNCYERLTTIAERQHKDPEDVIELANLAIEMIPTADTDPTRRIENANRVALLTSKRARQEYALERIPDFSNSFDDAIRMKRSLLDDENLDSQAALTADLNFYAWILATHPNDQLRNGEKSFELATLACELTGHSVSGFVDTLAAACAESGRFEEAVRWQKKALAEGNEDEKSEMTRRLEMYEQELPWRSASRSE